MAEVTPLEVSVLLPAHNEEDVIESTVRQLHEHLSTRAQKHEIIVIDNGSDDGTAKVGQRLQEELAPKVRYVRIEDKGLGYALQRGLKEAKLARVVLEAADLPFGTDYLEQFWSADPRIDIVIGSKALKETVTESPPLRKFVSWGYRRVIRLLLGMQTKDPQGTFFIRRASIERFQDRLDSPNYFFTTQLVLYAEHVGLTIKEVPVRYLKPRQGSHVRPFRDGMAVLKQVLSERSRMRRDPLRD